MEKKAKAGTMIALLLTSISMLASPIAGSVSGIDLKYKTPYLLPRGWIYVLVEQPVFSGIEASLTQYARDLESIDGFSVGIYTVWLAPTDSAAIRSFLQQALPEGLVGCLLVGDIPQANYEWVDWEHTYLRAPTDLYFMDLDGVWSDADGDRAYDTHTGDVGPEIWVGSLKPSLISGDKFQLLNNYFRKNHLYRTGEITVPNRALVYHDDYTWWPEFVEEWANNTIKVAYDETIIVNDPEVTIASDYLARLHEGYEWILLITHGWYGHHTFWHHGGWDGTVYGRDYRLIDPPTIFYVLSVCYATAGFNNVAGSCIFTDTYGLLAFGSRGTAWKGGPGIVGYPFDFPTNWHRTEFYTALSEGKCVGEAYLGDFRVYEDMMIEDPSYEIPGYEYLWQIVGDPSLRIKGYPPSVMATADIDPNTLNPKGKGKWITAYIQLPEGYDPADINATTILLNGTITPVFDPKYGFVTNSSEYLLDHNGDGILERMVKFDRAAVGSFVYSQGIRYGDVSLTMTGTLFDETPFEAIGTVKVLFPGDADDDGDVDFNDFIIFAGCYGCTTGAPNYNRLADFNEDGTIDYNDFIIFADNYGKTVL